MYYEHLLQLNELLPMDIRSAPTPGLILLWHLSQMNK